MTSKTAPVLLASMILLAAGSATAAPAMDVKVPFPFAVKDQILPAGQYRVERDEYDPTVVIIKGEGGVHTSLILRTIEAPGVDPAGDKSALVFTHGPDGYRLKDVWDDRHDGRELSLR
jgi:hypothetical protein